MKRNVLVTISAILGLASCSTGGVDVSKVNPRFPQVDVVNGKIVIDQETIQFKNNEKNIRITWQLPKNSKYVFPDSPAKAIEIIGGDQEFIQCNVEEQGLRYGCTNVHSRSGTYKYTITLVGTPAVPPLSPVPPYDPIIIND